MATAIVHTDGAAEPNPGHTGIGVHLQLEGGEVVEVSEYIGHGTNNEAEHRAIIRALRLAREHGVTDLEVRSDSELVVNQLSGEYRVKNPSLHRLHSDAKRLESEFQVVRYRWIPREQNTRADELASAALDRQLGRRPNESKLSLKEAREARVPEDCPFSRMRLPALLERVRVIFGDEAVRTLEAEGAVACRWALRRNSIDDGIRIAQVKAEVGRNRK